MGFSCPANTFGAARVGAPPLTRPYLSADPTVASDGGELAETGGRGKGWGVVCTSLFAYLSNDRGHARELKLSKHISSLYSVGNLTRFRPFRVGGGKKRPDSTKLAARVKHQPSIDQKIRNLRREHENLQSKLSKLRDRYARAKRVLETRNFGNIGSSQHEHEVNQIALQVRSINSLILRNEARIAALNKQASNEAARAEGDAANASLDAAQYFGSSAALAALSVPLPEERRVPADVAYRSRDGQSAFREAVISAYGCCAITGCSDHAALEAAHIIPYVDARSNLISNGVCLRADLHCLFDKNLLQIDENFRVFVSRQIKSSEYKALHHRCLILPSEPSLRPDVRLLQARLKLF